MKLLFSLFIVFITLTGFSQGVLNFEAANASYESSDFETALTKYESLISNNDVSFELFFNASNAAYNSNQIGKAILYINKALKFNPNNQDALHNLSLYNNSILDKTTESSSQSNGLANIIQREPNYWAWTTLFLGFIGFSLLILYLTSKGKRFKKIGFFAGCASLFFALITFVFSSINTNSYLKSTHAIVLSPSVEVKLTPSFDAENAFVLHEGSLVKLKQTDNEWIEIMFDNAKVGWIKTSDLGEI